MSFTCARLAASLMLLTAGLAHANVPSMPVDAAPLAAQPRTLMAAQAARDRGHGAAGARVDVDAAGTSVAMVQTVYRVPAAARVTTAAGWVDSVELLPATGPEPERYGLVIAGMGLIGIVVLRRKLEAERQR